MPFALGTLRLTIEQFDEMTPREYRAICKGYYDNQKNEFERIRYQAWMNGISVLYAIGVNFSKETKYPSFDKFMNNNNKKEEMSDKELFKLAQEKGVKIPEGVV